MQGARLPQTQKTSSHANAVLTGRFFFFFFINGFSIGFYGFSIGFYGFSIGFYGFSIGFYGFSIGFYGFSIGLLRVFYRSFTGFL